MNQQLVSDFLEKLIAETFIHSNIWRKLTPVSDQDSNQPLFFLLFENEFHHVNFDNSYTLSFKTESIYLVDERIESGRDDSVSEGLRLYIQPLPNDQIFLIPCDESELYRLNNAILSIQNPLPPTVTKFMEDYLRR